MVAAGERLGVDSTASPASQKTSTCFLVLSSTAVKTKSSNRERYLGPTTSTGPCCFIFLLKSFEWVIDTEVFTVGKTLNRDTLKNNEEVLSAAVRHLGLRVSVPTCQVHVGELYNFMDIDCPSHLTQNSVFSQVIVPANPAKHLLSSHWKLQDLCFYKVLVFETIISTQRVILPKYFPIC